MSRMWWRIGLTTAIIGGVILTFVVECVFSTMGESMAKPGWANEQAAALLTGAVMALAGMLVGNLAFHLFRPLAVVGQVLSSMVAGIITLMTGVYLFYFCMIPLWQLLCSPYPDRHSGDGFGNAVLFVSACLMAFAGLIFGSGLIQMWLKLDGENVQNSGVDAT